MQVLQFHYSVPSFPLLQSPYLYILPDFFLSEKSTWLLPLTALNFFAMSAQVFGARCYELMHFTFEICLSLVSVWFLYKVIVEMSKGFPVQWFLLDSLVEGLYIQIFKIVSVYIYVNSYEYPLLYVCIKIYVYTYILYIQYIHLQLSLSWWKETIYICPYQWVKLSFEKRGHCDDCKVPYNLLICFLSCGDSFVLCRMNNIRCIRGCSHRGLRFPLTLAAVCLPPLGLLLSGSPMIWENKNVCVTPGALAPWWKFKTWDVIRSLLKCLHWWLWLA